MTTRLSVDPTAQVAPTVVLGAPSPPHRYRPDLDEEIVVGPGVHIANYCVVYLGVRLDEGAIVEDHVTIEECVTIGSHTLVRSHAVIGHGATVEEWSVVGGPASCRIGPGVKIASHVRCMGSLLPAVRNPALSIEELARGGGEVAPTVENGAFIGWDAGIFGAVTIGENAYVTAGALVTRDVPARHIAFGTNQLLAGTSPEARRKFPDIEPGFFEKGCG